MYRVAAELVDQHWPDPVRVADGLGVVLLTWNMNCYRFGSFDFFALEHLLDKYQGALGAFRVRQLASLSAQRDTALIVTIFTEALTALASIRRVQGTRARTPVGVAKALHMLAPHFFPLWDEAIATGSGFYWASSDKKSNLWSIVLRRIE
jgi:hypothetical protein